MPNINNPMEILKILDKSNCGECNAPTCLAFSAAVARGQRKLDECPKIDKEVIKQFEGQPQEQKPSDLEMEKAWNRLMERFRKLDLASVSEKLALPYENGKLTLTILGKPFSVDANGKFYSDIHIHRWITGPVLNYILDGKGEDPKGKWIPFRELKGAKDWLRFYEHRCELPMKKIADTYTDFFADMLDIFSGTQVERHYDSDISIVLYPLPRLPILICYWKPEEGMESDFHVFFDETAEDNLNIESIYSLMTGLLIMFEKLAQRHT
jgi:hypothetical protein